MRLAGQSLPRPVAGSHLVAVEVAGPRSSKSGALLPFPVHRQLTCPKVKGRPGRSWLGLEGPTLKLLSASDARRMKPAWENA